MAMIECRECKTQISDQALGCPKCGAPLPSRNAAEKVASATSRRVSGLMFFGGLVWLFVAAQTGGADAFASAFGTAKWLIGAGILFYLFGELDRNLTERKRRKNEPPAN